MRIMAVDYGDVRTGIAVSDPTGTLTGDAWIVKAKGKRELIDLIINEAAARNVGTIVIGNPINMNGTRGIRSEKSEALAKSLRSKTTIDIILQDERLTTVEAHNILKTTGTAQHRKTVDALAAALILERFMAKSGSSQL